MGRVRPIGMRTPLTLAALLSLALPAFSQGWNTNGGPDFTAMAQRVTAQHRADAARASGIALERKIYGIPGNPATPAGTPAGSVFLTDKWKGPSPRLGDVIDIEAKRVIPWSAVAKGISRALPLISTAVAVKEVFDLVRCREAPGGLAECDDGAPPTPQLAYCYVHIGLEICSSQMTGVQATVVGRMNAASTAQFDYVAGPCDGNYAPAGRCAIFEINNGNMGLQSLWGYIQFYRATKAICIPYTVNGVQYTPTPGPDGMCPLGTYTPADYPEVELKIEQYGDKAKAPALVRAAEPAAQGLPAAAGFDHPAPQWTTPPVVQGGRETTLQPDGSTLTRDRDWTIQPREDGYEWEPRITERLWPPGVTPTAPGVAPGAGAPAPTIINNPGGGAPAVEIEVCGLPGKAPCKIDETGTPPPQEFFADPEPIFEPLKALPDTADIDFTWSFQLPSSCSPLVVGMFGAQLVNLDLCQYQPMIHDVMTIAWIFGTIFIATD